MYQCAIAHIQTHCNTLAHTPHLLSWRTIDLITLMRSATSTGSAGQSGHCPRYDWIFGGDALPRAIIRAHAIQTGIARCASAVTSVILGRLETELRVVVFAHVKFKLKLNQHQRNKPHTKEHTTGHVKDDGT